MQPFFAIGDVSTDSAHLGESTGRDVSPDTV